MDRQFHRHLKNSFVWLPERGMGYFPVREQPYDEHYFAKYVGYAQSVMGRAITRSRVDLVNRYTKGLVVDVGIGCGDFVQTRPHTLGYDINPLAVRWLQQRGLWVDPYAAQSVPAVSLWDVLEHIPEPERLLSRVHQYVFVSLPIVPGSGPPASDWRHLRRDEHMWYWTHDGFVAWMDAYGFVLREASAVETDLGRQDIETFVFARPTPTGD